MFTVCKIKKYRIGYVCGGGGLINWWNDRQINKFFKQPLVAALNKSNWIQLAILAKKN